MHTDKVVPVHVVIIAQVGILLMTESSVSLREASTGKELIINEPLLNTQMHKSGKTMYQHL